MLYEVITLVPFGYYGIFDETVDYRDIPWRNSHRITSYNVCYTKLLRSGSGLNNMGMSTRYCIYVQYNAFRVLHASRRSRGREGLIQKPLAAKRVRTSSGTSVITSYSIHYTKLYDWPDRHDDMRLTGKRHPYQADFVITSYSIHYTKLYDSMCCSAPPAVCRQPPSKAPVPGWMPPR